MKYLLSAAIKVNKYLSWFSPNFLAYSCTFNSIIGSLAIEKKQFNFKLQDFFEAIAISWYILLLCLKGTTIFQGESPDWRP